MKNCMDFVLNVHSVTFWIDNKTRNQETIMDTEQIQIDLQFQLIREHSIF